MFIFAKYICYNYYTVIDYIGDIKVMFNSRFLKSSSGLVGSSLVLSSVHGFGAAADLEDVSKEVENLGDESAATVVSLDVPSIPEELRVNWALLKMASEIDLLKDENKDLSADLKKARNKKRVFLKFFVALLYLDLFLALIRGRKEFKFGVSWDCLASWNKVLYKYWFFGNIFDGIAVGIKAAWDGVPLLKQIKEKVVVVQNNQQNA